MKVHTDVHDERRYAPAVREWRSTSHERERLRQHPEVQLLVRILAVEGWAAAEIADYLDRDLLWVTAVLQGSL